MHHLKHMKKKWNKNVIYKFYSFLGAHETNKQFGELFQKFTELEMMLEEKETQIKLLKTSLEELQLGK